MTPHTSDDIELGELVIKGYSLKIHTLYVDGKNDIEDFLWSLDTGHSDDATFLDKTIGYLRVIAAEGIACSERYFRRISNKPDQWEVRLQRGKLNFRLYGFLIGNEFYLVTWREKHSNHPDPAALQKVKITRELWLSKFD